VLGVSEARGGLTNLVSVTYGGNLIVANGRKETWEKALGSQPY